MANVPEHFRFSIRRLQTNIERALAGLVAVFGLGMANVAGFYGLQQSWGPVWAAASVAVADLIIALIIVLLGTSHSAGAGDRARIRCSQNGH